MQVKKSEILPKLKLLSSVNNILKLENTEEGMFGVVSGGESTCYLRLKLSDMKLPDCYVSADELTKIVPYRLDDFGMNVVGDQLVVTDTESNVELNLKESRVPSFVMTKKLTQWGGKEFNAFFDASKLSLTETGNKFSSVICSSDGKESTFIGSARINIYCNNIVRDGGNPYRFVIPLESVKLLKDLVNVYGYSVEIHTSNDNIIGFIWKDCTFISSTVVLEVDFSSFLERKTNYESVITINKEKLQFAIKAVSSTAQNTHGCAFEFANGRATLLVKTESVRENKKWIPCLIVGNPVSVKMNYNTLNLFCEVSNKDSIRLSFSDKSEPVTIDDGGTWFGKSNLMTYRLQGDE